MIKENHLRLYGYMPRRPTNTVVRRGKIINFSNMKRDRGDLKNFNINYK